MINRLFSPVFYYRCFQVIYLLIFCFYIFLILNIIPFIQTSSILLHCSATHSFWLDLFKALHRILITVVMSRILCMRYFLYYSCILFYLYVWLLKNVRVYIYLYIFEREIIRFVTKLETIFKICSESQIWGESQIYGGDSRPLCTLTNDDVYNYKLVQ